MMCCVRTMLFMVGNFRELFPRATRVPRPQILQRKLSQIAKICKRFFNRYSRNKFVDSELATFAILYLNSTGTIHQGLLVIIPFFMTINLMHQHRSIEIAIYS